jgi:hypothetical protein
LAERLVDEKNTFARGVKDFCLGVVITIIGFDS